MLRALFAAAPHLEGLTSLHKCCNGGDLAGQAIEYDGVCEFSEHGDAGSVATPACLCGLPAESPGEKLSQEKSRLRDMARDFFKRAEWGIPLKLVDPETRALVQCLFRVDSCFRHCCFSGDPPLEHTLRLRELDEPLRGGATSDTWPATANCVLIRTVTGSQCFVCCFATAKEAEDFFSCMSILRLSVLIAAGLASTPAGAAVPSAPDRSQPVGHF